MPSRIEGPATQLIMGERGEALKQLEIKVKKQTREAEVEAVEAMKRGLGETCKEAKATAEREQALTQERIVELEELLAAEKLKVLITPSSELIKLNEAKCSWAKDEEDIRRQLSGNESEITERIADLLRDNVCGVKRVRSGSVDGPLGRLLLDGSPVDLRDFREALGSFSGTLHLAEWLRSQQSPKAALRLPDNAKVMTNVSPILMQEMEVTTSFKEVTIGDFPLPIKALKGIEPATSLDLSGKKLGGGAGILIAALIRDNGSLTEVSQARGSHSHFHTHRLIVAPLHR